MANSRPLLLPLLFRRSKNLRPHISEAQSPWRLSSRWQKPLVEPRFHTSSQKQQTQIKRYGPATEPDPRTSGSDGPPLQDASKAVLPEQEQEPNEIAIEASPRPPLTPPPLLDSQPGPPDRVLHMEAPTEKRRSLHAPQYIHHFDSYTLVQDLAKGGFSYDQSVTIMKAIRVLLVTNLQVARDGLVSKSDVENVGIAVHRSS